MIWVNDNYTKSTIFALICINRKWSLLTFIISASKRLTKFLLLKIGGWSIQCPQNIPLMLINFNKIKYRQGLGNILSPCKILSICLQIMPPSMKESSVASKRQTALYIQNYPCNTQFYIQCKWFPSIPKLNQYTW